MYFLQGGIPVKKRKLLGIIVAVIVLLTASLSTHADFGDYGGDYDYGGYDSFDSYDSYDYDYNDYDYDYDDNNDDYYYYGGSGGSYSGGGSGGSSDGSALAGAVVIAVIIAIVVLSMRKNGKNSSYKKPGVVMPGAQATDAALLKPMEQYTSLDPDFSAGEFKDKLSNLYVRFQNCWQAKDIEELRPYLTDSFFSQMNTQLNAYRMKGQTNHVERISVLGVDLMGWGQESGTDYIIARLRTRIVDYVTDDSTGAVVRGSDTAEKFMDYEWKVVRSTGTKTSVSTGTTAQICPNCGAHVDINRTAKCEYCGSILTTDTFDWAVSSIKGISQRTGS